MIYLNPEFVMTLETHPFCPVQREKFLSNYSHFADQLEGPGGELWRILNSEESFQKMRWATEDMELPAVAGVVRVCAPFVKSAPEKKRNRLKQGIGAMVCAVMDANGYEKTGKKKAVPPVPERVFSVGECYRKRTGP